MRNVKSSSLSSTRKALAQVIRALLLAVLSVTPFLFATAQQPTPKPPSTSDFLVTNPPSRSDDSIAPADERYRIGPGDVLDIRVFNRPQLSREAVRVDGRGMIRMPFIEGEIQAACRTESELAGEITARYLKYQRNPQVDVFIKEYQSQPVAVIGAVNSPGRFQLQRRIRLLELLTFAGGPSARAGRTVQIIRTAGTQICEAQHGEELPGDTLPEDFASYSLSEMLRPSDARLNPYVRPGDIVSIPDAEQVFVVGNVLRPSSIPLKEPITVSRAIAMAGGTLPDTKSDKVRIIRQVSGTAGKNEIYVDIKAIDKRRAEDVMLQAGDIVDVPTSSGKRLLRNLIGAVVPAVGQLPVRVIP